MMFTYATHFCCLTADTEWNDAAQLYLFRWSLWEKIKDELAHVEMPTNLNAIVDLAVHTDNHLCERTEEKWGFPQPP